MSLFQKAAAAIRQVMEVPDDRVRAMKRDLRETMDELEAAHTASTQSLQPGDGQQIVVAGSAQHGFLVSMHDGTFFQSMALEARDAVDAIEHAMQKWSETSHELEPPVVPEDPDAPVLAQEIPEPAPVMPERPFAADPGTLDVTRGRVGDEIPGPADGVLLKDDAGNLYRSNDRDEILRKFPGTIGEDFPGRTGPADPHTEVVPPEVYKGPESVAEPVPGVVEASVLVVPLGDPVSDPVMEPIAEPQTPGEHIVAAEEKAAAQQTEAEHVEEASPEQPPQA